MGKGVGEQSGDLERGRGTAGWGAEKNTQRKETEAARQRRAGTGGRKREAKGEKRGKEERQRQRSREVLFILTRLARTCQVAMQFVAR